MALQPNRKAVDASMFNKDPEIEMTAVQDEQFDEVYCFWWTEGLVVCSKSRLRRIVKCTSRRKVLVKRHSEETP